MEMIKMKCPKCQGTNIWYHPENDDWFEFWYCPKCQIDINKEYSYPYEVDDDGRLFFRRDSAFFAKGSIKYFEFADIPAQEQLFQHSYFPELARIDIHLNLENPNPTMTKSFSIHKLHIKPLRDLLNKILEEIEKENE